jgi:hypothetical protein
VEVWVGVWVESSCDRGLWWWEGGRVGGREGEKGRWEKRGERGSGRGVSGGRKGGTIYQLISTLGWS